MPIDIGDIPTGTPPTTGEKLQIRTAIGLGQTDAPTFLAQTLTGQSLTGTQATSLVDLSATWNTTGNPSLIYGRVTNTNSGASANLIDLGTFAGGSLFSVSKAGAVTAQSLNIIQTASANIFSTSAAALQTSGYLGVARAINLIDTAGISWSSTSTLLGATGTNLLQDAAGILAQRNGTSAQAFRVANSVGASPLVDYDRGVFDFKTTTNTLRIGTENGGTYTTARPIEFVVGGVVRMSIAATGLISTSASLIVNNTVVCGPSSNFEWNGRSSLSSSADGLIKIANYLGTDFSRLQLGGTTSAFPAIKRNGTGIHIVLADDSGFAPLTAGAITGPGGTGINSSGVLGLLNRITMYPPSDGVLTWGNNAGGDFGRFQLGGTADTHPAIARDGAGIKFTGAATGLTSWIKVPAVTVSALPAAATAGVGARAFVNNALNPVFGNAVVGSGLSTVPVYSDGTNWNVG